ncbi:MAG: DUF4389 domain-containing protein [Rhodospirillaceae bacterium]|nr:DUF4389 domain-containing protein [Rhodospirillaceae bacterium]MBT4046683.1 DUF4389 domain-containing protein [Rhodospirillaceae bacterium]MBT4691243.1 DUF4389 domain-containing protein [Rhodospirillaceae bacterium]MBT5082530.1 DUF4389 domain-containing protein [Rhodospirillaceae bacterium]MBT5525405.1 DUF4389 domain-containing protein [Rhodospirillaceae bacterium]
MEEKLKANLKDQSIWQRLCFMVLFAVIFNIAEFAIMAIAVVQFFSRLATGSVNEELRSLGPRLGQYLQQIVAFETFYTDVRPYPFAPFPAADAVTSADGHTQAG